MTMEVLETMSAYLIHVLDAILLDFHLPAGLVGRKFRTLSGCSTLLTYVLRQTPSNHILLVGVPSLIPVRRH